MITKSKKQSKVGDALVDFGQVCKIFKIKKRKSIEGKEEKVIFFKPYYKTSINGGLTYSILRKNLKKTKIRKPISKKELKRLFKKLSKRESGKKFIKAIKVKEVLNLNDPKKIVLILKNLWLEKNDQSKNFTITKRGVFNLTTERLVEEVAFVGNMSLEKAREKIKKALENSLYTSKA